MPETSAIAMRIAASGRMSYPDVMAMGAHEVLDVLAILDYEDEAQAMRSVFEHRLDEYNRRPK